MKPSPATIEPNKRFQVKGGKVFGHWSREAIREYNFLHQFSITADAALNAFGQRSVTILFLDLAKNALYPDLGPTEIYKRLQFRWQKYCAVRKRIGFWSYSRGWARDEKEFQMNSIGKVYQP